MQSDDELCLCFHVTRRKVESYLRIEKPRRLAQLSECYGAGTGCGWCRKFLRQMFEAAVESESREVEFPAAQSYAQQRGDYVRAGGGTPPAGATPIGPNGGPGCE